MKSPTQQNNKSKGVASRICALGILEAVLDDGRNLDEVLDEGLAKGALRKLNGRDRAFARLLAATVLRRLGQIDNCLKKYLSKPLAPSAVRVKHMLRLGVAELLFLGHPGHVAVHSIVSLFTKFRELNGFKGLTNAVLRRISENTDSILETQDAEKLNCVSWLWKRWVKNYGEDTTRAMMKTMLDRSPIDLTVKADSGKWADTLGGVPLDNGSVRINSTGRITDLEGFTEGEWWVQDVAATLPVHLLGDVSGVDVLDLCAAPGGKTMQLAALGANVTAIDKSPQRIELVEESARRLGYSPVIQQFDILDFEPGRTWTHILLDAPCSATGTGRKHPDMMVGKSSDDLKSLSKLQKQLIEKAVSLLSPGGVLIYCTCSLEPEEGENQIRWLLKENPSLVREPLDKEDVFGWANLISSKGDLRTTPADLSDYGGMDGFFAARIRHSVEIQSSTDELNQKNFQEQP
ncbi:MAG: MFS transporter [Hyphomicrobiales bacterium]|nr:MAG: MFS transporter [Hyphomicrobiales bacterium]